MALDNAQLASLATHIRGNSDPDVVAALALRNDTELVRLYNLNSAFHIWRTAIPPAEYKAVIVWTEVDTITNGNARIWEWVSENMRATLDGSDANIRQGIADAFASSSGTLTALTAVAKGFATVFENVFTTGTGSVADPGDLVVTGPVTIRDIGKALNEF